VTRNGGGALPLDTFGDEDLGDRLAREQVLAVAVAVDVLEQVVSALDAAHAAGMEHRDVFAYPVDSGSRRRSTGPRA
jgi:hypothetical protein